MTQMPGVPDPTACEVGRPCRSKLGCWAWVQGFSARPTTPDGETHGRSGGCFPPVTPDAGPGSGGVVIKLLGFWDHCSILLCSKYAAAAKSNLRAAGICPITIILFWRKREFCTALAWQRLNLRLRTGNAVCSDAEEAGDVSGSYPAELQVSFASRPGMWWGHACWRGTGCCDGSNSPQL